MHAFRLFKGYSDIQFHIFHFFSKDLIIFDLSLLVTAGCPDFFPNDNPSPNPHLEWRCTYLYDSMQRLCKGIRTPPSNSLIHHEENDPPSPGSSLHKASFRRAKRALRMFRFLRAASTAGQTTPAKMALGQIGMLKDAVNRSMKSEHS